MFSVDVFCKAADLSCDSLELKIWYYGVLQKETLRQMLALAHKLRWTFFLIRKVLVHLV